MYTKGILERYANTLTETDQTRFRAAIALIIFDGTDDQATCGGADVMQMLALPTLQHLADDFNSRWICFVQQKDLTGLRAAFTGATGTETK